MSGPAMLVAAAGVVLLFLGGDARTHALAQRYDLPLPLGYFLLAAGAAVAASFVILARFWRHNAGRGDHARSPPMQGAIPNAVVACCQAIGVGVLALIVCAGLFGNQSTFKNIAPVAVWVVWWVGFSFICAFVGNVWRLINPWAALFDFAERLARPWPTGLSLRLPYPRSLGAWPACALLLLFAWLELVVPGRDVPRNIAIGIALYSVMTWAGFVAFGREAWLRGGEVFSVVFELFGRFAPVQFTHKSGWYWSLHPFAAGLLVRTPLVPSMTAFTLLLLGTVTVDGFMETPLWAEAVENLIGNPGKGVDARAYMFLQSALLVAGPLLLAVLYLTAVALMARIARTGMAPLAGLFVLSLVPIAIAYHLAHYFSLLAIAGQFIIPLASDPFGYGWDLFGTTLYRIDIGLVDARFTWYLAVAAIVIGHIIAVWIGHVTAYTVFHEANAARRSQYPMLVLMIGYTMLSLWILAQPIIEPTVK
jgi:hypothetical protein